MELFPVDSSRNLLPYDGEVNDHGPVLSASDARHYFHTLLENVPWKNDETVIFGKRIITARKIAWYGDREFSYTYSGTTKKAMPWNTELIELKTIVESISGDSFNSCLLNLYHHGGEGMSWHSDDEKMLIAGGSIASVSLGAERKFSFKHKQTKENVFVPLKDGSLLIMKGSTQRHWLHALPKSTRVLTPRINLTFRQMAVSAHGA